MSRKHWLVKTEPNVFSIQDLAESPDQTTCWDGVRNYQARNFLRDQMQVGDAVLVYHSNAKPSAVAGTATVVREGYPDATAFDLHDPHYDPKSDPGDPRWYMVDIQLERVFPRPLPLAELRDIPELSEMELLRKGSRLSVQPVRPAEYERIIRLADSD